MGQEKLWDDGPAKRPSTGEVRRALDRDLKAAEAAGTTFLATEVAALRRQANDLDRLERMMATSEDAKTWDYQPKTAAHVAYAAAVRLLFGKDGDDDDDPFTRAVEGLRAAQVRDAQEPEPAD